MKTERFQSGQLIVERIRSREGPPVVYIAFNGKTARPFTDKKELFKSIRCPKSIPTGEKIRDWIDSFDQPPGNVIDGIAGPVSTGNSGIAS